MARNPVDKERRTQILAAEKKAYELAQRIEQCERCMMNMNEHRAVLEFLTNKLAAYHREFIGVEPGGPIPE